MQYKLSKYIFYIKLPKLQCFWNGFQLFDHVLRVILSLKHQHRLLLALCVAIYNAMGSEQLNKTFPTSTYSYSLISNVIIL